MILKKQKTFNSQAQKLRRAKTDLTQGIDSYNNVISKKIDIGKEAEAGYKKAASAPIDLKDESKKIGKSAITKDQAMLRNAGRLGKSDTSIIGKRGANSFVKPASTNIAQTIPETTIAKPTIKDIATKTQNSTNILNPSSFTNNIKQKKISTAVNIGTSDSVRGGKVITRSTPYTPGMKRAGKIAAGLGIAAGLSYGGYKAYQHFKNKKKDDNTKG
jgi:hypothetical protein